MRICVGDATVSKHNLEVLDVVCRKAVLSREVKETSSENKTADAHRGNTSTYNTQFVGVQECIYISPAHARADGGNLLVRADTDLVQLGKVYEETRLIYGGCTRVRRVSTASDREFDSEKSDSLDSQCNVFAILG